MSAKAIEFITPVPDTKRRKGKQVSHIARIVRLDRIRRFDDQPRTWFDVKEQTARAESFKEVGVQVDIIVEEIFGDPDHDYELVDGESRWRSAKEADLEEMEVLVRTQPFGSKTEKHLASLVANSNRSPHTPMDTSRAYHYQVTKGGLTQKELAKAIGEEEAMVSNYLSLQNLRPEVQKLLEPFTPKKERLSASTGILVARLPKELQLEVLSAARGADGKVKKWRVAKLVEKFLGKRKRKASPTMQRERVERTARELETRVETLHALAEDGAIPQEKASAMSHSTIMAALEVLQGMKVKLLAPRLKDGPQPPLTKNVDLLSGVEKVNYLNEWRAYWISGVSQDKELPETLLDIAFPRRKRPKTFQGGFEKWYGGDGKSKGES